MKAWGKGHDRGWDGWRASLTQWTWVWAGSRSWWWTGKPGVLQSTGSRSVGHDWGTELNWIYWIFVFLSEYCYLVPRSCPTLLWPQGLKPTRLLSPWDFRGKYIGVGCHALLQGIFLTQGWNSHACNGR